MARPYPEVPSQPRLAELEERVLAYWKEHDLFRASIANRPAGKDGANEFVFYDGPPFANGLPHYGHLLTSYVKDIVPRYQTMRGKRVERRFGWDCHGLPAEMESEKELGISGRAKITEYGIERFNAHCRSSVMKYTKEWEGTVTRAARWVDFAHDYKTMDLSYMESVMWAFAELFKKGLVYESYRVMPYSWAAETPVSNFETRMDNSYRERQDPALTVRFALERVAGDGAPTELWAWTTTPWTLPSNLALAVGPELDYAVFEKDGKRVVLGATVLAKYEKELAGAARVATAKGKELVGRRYTPLFPYFAGTKNAFRVLAGDFVDTTEGTGVVHMAPGFGEDDQRVCAENGIEMLVPVDEKGNFTAAVPEWQGVNVFEANKPIIAVLKQRGVLVRHDTLVHNYPHCWRTDQPLIYRAMPSWYVEVTKIRERMVALNQKIRWIPEHVRDGQFGKWLEGARDWSISRNRFWGSPIPVWKSPSGKLKVFGSIAELEQASGQKVTDLHRPFIDQIVIREGGEEYRRVEEVLDCWFESGSMPFAQSHYPFENRALVEEHSADFIVEYIAQTRGWFYTMHVLSVALFDRPAFKNCICHGVVLDADGRKLSKRLRNYPDPEEVFETIGSDALRWFLVSSPILRGGDLRIDRDGSAILDSVRLVLNPIWNTWHFFALYANVSEHQARWRIDSTHLLDRYILAKTRELVTDVQASLDNYELAEACNQLVTYLDALTNWYVRRSRDRFWGAAGERGDADAFDTLFTVLHTVLRVAAPLLPLVSEDIYQALTGERSVHLSDWPDVDSLPDDPALVAAMDKVREVCSAALSLREGHGLRVRLPLARLTVAGRAASLVEPFVELIADELNVKRVELTDEVNAIASFVLKPNGKLLGPKLGSDVQKVMKAARDGAWTAEGDGTVIVAGQSLQPGEFELALQARPGEATTSLRANDTVVNLDIDVTRELAAEGTARDLVRLVQDARKRADLDVTDRIRLTLALPEPLRAVIQGHERVVADATLSAELTYSELAQPIDGRLDSTDISFDVQRLS